MIRSGVMTRIRTCRSSRVSPDRGLRGRERGEVRGRSGDVSGVDSSGQIDRAQEHSDRGADHADDNHSALALVPRSPPTRTRSQPNRPRHPAVNIPAVHSPAVDQLGPRHRRPGQTRSRQTCSALIPELKSRQQQHASGPTPASSVPTGHGGTASRGATDVDRTTHERPSSPARRSTDTVTAARSPVTETSIDAPPGAAPRAKPRASAWLSPRASDRAAKRAASTQRTWSIPARIAVRPTTRTSTAAGSATANSAVAIPRSRPALTRPISARVQRRLDDPSQCRPHRVGLHDGDERGGESHGGKRADGILGGGHPGVDAAATSPPNSDRVHSQCVSHE